MPLLAEPQLSGNVITNALRIGDLLLRRRDDIFCASLTLLTRCLMPKSVVNKAALPNCELD